MVKFLLLKPGDLSSSSRTHDKVEGESPFTKVSSVLYICVAHSPEALQGTYIHTCMHACIHTYIHTYMHTYIHTCIHTCMHAYIHTCMHAYIHTYIHTYIHACMHIIQQKATD